MRAITKLLLAALLCSLTFSATTPSQALTVHSSAPKARAVAATAANQTVSVRWAKALSTAKFKITGYQVSASAGSSRVTKTLGPSSTTVRFKGLTNGKSYRIAVHAISGRLISKPSVVYATPTKSKLANSITFSQPADMFLGAEAQKLFATSSASIVVFTSLTPAVCSVNGDKVSPLANGDCYLRASSPATSTHVAALPVDVVLTIVAAPKPVEKVLLWSEEFKGAAGTAPSSSRFTPDIGDGCQQPHNNCGWGNAERQYYLAEASKLDGSTDGVLNITANRQTSGTNYNCYYGRCDFTSGKLTTYGKVGFTYGYMEARIKLPKGGGTWPAFWMLGNNIATVPWPYCGEIDIMEYKGKLPTITHGTLHFAGPTGSHQMLGGTKDALTDLSLDYHRYGMLWKPDEVTFFLDDNVVYRAQKSDSGLSVWPFGPNAQGAHPSFYMILNLAMGGNFGGAVDASVNSAALSVDWVRYYSVDGLGKVNSK